MTISSTPRKAGPYVGNGIATSFSFAFKVFVASDLVVTKTSVASGAESVLTLTTDYTVSLNADQNTNPGGIVTYNPGGVPMPSTYNLTITSEVPQTQGTDIPNAGGFYPEVLEDALDKNVILAQQLEEVVSRTLQFPVADSTPPQIPPFATRKNRVLGFDGNGLFTTYPTTAGVAAGSFADTTIATAGQTVINVRQYVMGVNTLAVFLNGVRQEAGADYTETTSTSYTFTFALAAGDRVISVIGQESAGIGATDAALVSYLPAGAGAVVSNVQTKLREIMSVRDRNGGVATVTAAQLQAAIDAMEAAGGGTLLVPSKTTLIIDAQVIVKPGVFLKGGDAIPENVYAASLLPLMSVTYGSGSTTNPAFLLRTSSGMSGFTFSYPNQVTSASSTPIQYGYSIATDTAWAGSGNVDNVYLENIFLRNSYYGISLDKAGRFYTRNIHGQPIAKGLYIDRVYDIGRSEHIHFWTYHATPGSNLYAWMRANAKAYDIGRVDGWHVDDIFSYGYQYGMHLRNPSGNGSPWVLGTNICMDVCSKPIYIEKAERLQLTNIIASSDNGYAVGLDTGTDTGGVVQIKNYQAFGVGIGVVVRSVSGRYSISSPHCKPENGTGQCDVASIICTGQTPVTLDGFDTHLLVYGSTGVVLNGVNLPSLDTDVTPSGFATPDTWAANPKCTAITGGSRFNLDTTVTTQTFTFAAGIKEAQGIYTLEFDVKFAGNITNTAASQFYFRIKDGTAKIYVLFPEVQTEVKFETVTRIRIPFIMDFGDTAEFVWGTTAGSSAGDSVEITNMKIWQQATYKSNNQQIAMLLGKNNFLDPRAVGPIVAFDYGKKILYLSAAPTAAPCEVGDRTVRNPPAAAQPKAWVCTVAGSPGTQVSEGNL